MRTFYGTFSILGKSQYHVNVTGVESFDLIILVVLYFCHLFNVEYNELTSVNIDCVTAIAKVKSGLHNKIINNFDNAMFQLSVPEKFPAIILRNKNLPTLSYFIKNGKLLIVGCIGVNDINYVVKQFNTFINTCS